MQPAKLPPKPAQAPVWDETAPAGEDLRLDPQLRLCPKFDSVSIARFPVAPRDEMGVRVVDNCAEEHIM
jgi:hypothetical protein